MIDDDSFATFKLHRLREPRPRASRTTCSPSSRGSTAASPRHREPRRPRASSGADRGSPARTPSSSTFINRYGFLPNGVRAAAAWSAARAQIDDNDFFRAELPGRLRPAVRQHRSPTSSTSATSGPATRRTSLRTSNGWGNDHGSRRHAICPANRVRRAAGLLPGAASCSRASTLPNGVRCRSSTPSSSRRTSRSTTSSGSATGRSTSASWSSNDELYGQGLRANVRTRLRLRGGARRTSTRCTRSTSSDMLQPRLGAIWAYSGAEHDLRQLRPLHPGGQLAAARGVVGAQLGRPGQRLLRPERQLHRLDGARPRSSGQVLRRRPRPAHHRRVPDRHGARARHRLDGAGPRPLPLRLTTSGKTPTTTSRLRYNPPAGDPARALHPEPARPSAARSAARPTSSPSSTARSPSTTRPASRASGAAQQRVRSRLLRLEPLLRQLRPGQQRPTSSTTTQHLHRLVEHRRRRRPPALGLQVRQPARRPPPPAEALRLLRAALERERRRLRDLPVRPAVGGAQLPSLPRDPPRSTSDTNRYAEPAGSNTTDDHYQLDLNYTQDFPIGERFNIQGRVDIFNVFDKQTGYNIQTTSTAPASACRRRSTTRGGSSCRCASSSKRPLGHAVDGSRPAALNGDAGLSGLFASSCPALGTPKPAR